MATFSSPRQPTARETAASIAVLAVIVALCVWLAVQQRHFSPAVTVAASAMKAAETTAVRPADRSGADNAQPAAAGAPSAGLLRAWPAGLRAMSPAEVFTADTLSDKIDGKAELYLSAGVIGMRCQRVAAGPDGDSADATAAAAPWFETFVYDMGTPENAFSVYSSQKRTTTTDAGIGDYGYIAGNQVCAVHGQYYLECVGADDSAATRNGALALARAFIAATPVARHANVTKDESLFPEPGLEAGSIMLMSADVFGFDQLTNTYVARYREGGEPFALFLTRRATAAEATQLAAAVRRFFVEDCGGHEVAAPATPAGPVIVDEGGSFDAVFAVGPFVAGVHQVPSRDAAERWVQRLADRLSAAKP